jgi:hypothetical protein
MISSNNEDAIDKYRLSSVQDTLLYFNKKEEVVFAPHGLSSFFSRCADAEDGCVVLSMRECRAKTPADFARHIVSNELTNIFTNTNAFKKK